MATQFPPLGAINTAKRHAKSESSVSSFLEARQAVIEKLIHIDRQIRKIKSLLTLCRSRLAHDTVLPIFVSAPLATVANQSFKAKG